MQDQIGLQNVSNSGQNLHVQHLMMDFVGSFRSEKV